MGRPPKYKTVSEMQDKIDEYFETGRNTREVIIGTGANQKAIQVPVPTITGLCIFLGFCDRASFYDYGKKPGFSHTIKMAKQRMESYYEETMCMGGNPSGPIFALKNFGWSDKREIEHSGSVGILDEIRKKNKKS